MIVYGANAVREALAGRRAHTLGQVWATPRVARAPWLRQTGVRSTDAEELERICGSPGHQGVCAEVGPYPYVSAHVLLEQADPLIVALDELQDPQNLGAVCRTAECVGATGIVLPERRSAEVTPAVCKAAAGAVEHLALAQVRNLTDFLTASKAAGCWCYGASPGAARPYDAPDYRGGLVLVFGGEGRGLRPRVAGACDELISLPQRGRVASLNVSAAAAAVLYEALQRRRALDNAP